MHPYLHQPLTYRAIRDLPVGISKGWRVFLSNAHLERLKVVEHLAQRHALDSVLVLDQDRLVGPFGKGTTHVDFLARHRDG